VALKITVVLHSLHLSGKHFPPAHKQEYIVMYGKTPTGAKGNPWVN
jgi:hypothetical protein